jgi:hypothetical protein
LKFVSHPLPSTGKPVAGMFGITPGAPFPGTKWWASKTGFITLRPHDPPNQEATAKIRQTSTSLTNYGINVGSHEAGHASGALPQYAADSLKNTAEPGTVMETNVPLEELLKAIREFSVQDAQDLAKHLNKVTSETNPVTGK